MSDTETAYLLARAETEAVAAIKADDPSASVVHQELSMRYSAKAVMELTADDAMDQCPS